MSSSRPVQRAYLCGLAVVLAFVRVPVRAQESPYIYGIHDHDTGQQEWLNHVATGGATGWVTATIAIGHDPGQTGGDDFRWISNQGHTVICRLNNGYGDAGTIPVPGQYGNFAQRCANYVAASQGCSHYIIGNETNLACEWPKVGGWRSYLSPQSYADCFRQCYNAIKQVAPGANVLCQALAPFAGPYGAGPDHDGNPLGWTEYMNQMLTAINSTGGIDGIAAHITSRGYTHADVHSTAKVNGQYWSFYVYKDWVNLGTPASMRTLPYYATECNGMYYWKGGHPECTDPGNPSCSYQADWIEWIYAEIDNWNQAHAASGEGIYHCVNMYRWCAWCDDWNIDGSPPKGQILTDLDDAVAHGYRWDGGAGGFTNDPPTGTNLSLTAAQVQTDSVYGPEWGGDKAIDGIVSSESKWTSDGSAPPHWLSLDIGGTRTINGFAVVMPGAVPEGSQFNAEAFSIQSASSMSGPWTTEVSVDNSEQEDIVYRSYINPKTLRYVRLYITDPGIDNWARIQEFEVWGEPPANPPVADFVGAPRSGTAPLVVSFTDQSTGTIDTWSWSFGDQGTSQQPSPSHNYLNAGTYTVSLMVSGPGGDDTEIKTNYITVSPGSPGSNLIANGDFDDDLNGWTTWIERDLASDFTASVVSGELRQTGTNYNAGVWQQFSTGGAGTYIDVAGVWRSQPSIPDYQWGEVIIINSDRTPVNGVDEGGQADDVLIYKNDTWASPGGWNGNMADTAPVANLGTFVAADDTATILLKSGNTGGTSSGVVFDDLMVTANQPPTADIQVDRDSGSAPLTVHFDASGSSDPENDELDYDWDFDDNGTGSGVVIDHTFTTADTYTVTLTVDDRRGGVDTDTVQITVTQPTGYIGDFDGDDDVDQEDFGFFQACLTGSGGEPPAPACAPARLDGDDDVDQDDFAIFQPCMSGANVPPPSACLH